MTSSFFQALVGPLGPISYQSYRSDKKHENPFKVLAYLVPKAIYSSKHLIYLSFWTTNQLMNRDGTCGPKKTRCANVSPFSNTANLL